MRLARFFLLGLAPALTGGLSPEVALGADARAKTCFDAAEKGQVLRDEGRRAAQAFLSDHHEDLGRRSTLDLDELLEGI